ncbi:hypothetical protein V1517DRAFT_376682 [Lipomyces orientalis]|uniref:Uncharacterized protein n=1 Tax=Lipomyces orientalis TaxID=1233043 RepID=A0ACC3TDN8_9ASCO
MINWDSLVFNIAAFACALVVLELGADKFIDHTAIVSSRLGVSQSLVALLTAGAEWEELAVVIASLSQHHSSLALGNVVGSTISNILGAFSLGLLFHNSNGNGLVFDGSSKIYSAILLAMTTIVTVALVDLRIAGKVFGGVLIGSFVLYIGSVLWGISRGRMTAPELSDSDDSSDDGESDSETDDDNEIMENNRNGVRRQDEEEARIENGASDSIPLRIITPRSSLSTPSHLASRPSSPSRKSRPSRGLVYHVFQLLLGFLAVGLSGYILSHSASTIAAELQISGFFFGIVILSLATTLPEKFVAMLSGFRGHGGILVANTVGSNMFLLTLCLGIILIDTGGTFDAGSVSVMELVIMWISTLALVGTVWFGGKWSRPIGAGMVGLYILFLVLEVTLHREEI